MKKMTEGIREIVKIADLDIPDAEERYAACMDEETDYLTDCLTDYVTYYLTDDLS